MAEAKECLCELAFFVWLEPYVWLKRKKSNATKIKKSEVTAINAEDALSSSSIEEEDEKDGVIDVIAAYNSIILFNIAIVILILNNNLCTSIN